MALSCRLKFWSKEQSSWEEFVNDIQLKGILSICGLHIKYTVKFIPYFGESCINAETRHRGSAKTTLWSWHLLLRSRIHLFISRRTTMQLTNVDDDFLDFCASSVRYGFCNHGCLTHFYAFVLTSYSLRVMWWSGQKQPMHTNCRSSFW